MKAYDRVEGSNQTGACVYMCVCVCVCVYSTLFLLSRLFIQRWRWRDERIVVDQTNQGDPASGYQTLTSNHFFFSLFILSFSKSESCKVFIKDLRLFCLVRLSIARLIPAIILRLGLFHFRFPPFWQFICIHIAMRVGNKRLVVSVDETTDYDDHFSICSPLFS